MPLYLQSLRLSVQTFWRYLIVMVLSAFLVVLLIRKLPISQWVWLFTLLPVVAVLIAFFMISLLLAGVLGIVMLAEVFCALVARGYKIRLEIGHLLRAAVVFGLITIVAWFATGLVGAAILFIAGLAGGPGDAQALVDHLRDGSPVAYVILLLVLIPPTLYLSASVVPLTAMVHAGEIRKTSQDVTFGFGKGLRHLVPIMMVILYVGALTVVLGNTGLILVVAEPSNGMIIPLVWAASWFFSLAVLIWEQTAAQNEQDRALAAQRTRIDPRSLCEARARKNPEIA